MFHCLGTSGKLISRKTYFEQRKFLESNDHLVYASVHYIIPTMTSRQARGKKNTVMQSNQSLSEKSKKYKWRAVSSSLWQNVARTRTQKFKDALTNILTLHQRSKVLSW